MYAVFLRLSHLFLAVKLWISSWLWWSVVKVHKVVRKPCFDADRSALKLPLHVAFLIQESDISLEDVASLVVWSMALGIQVVTVHDDNGSLKSSQGQLLAIISRRKEEVFGEDASKYTISIVRSTSEFTGSQRHHTRLNIVSPSDGRQAIVSMAKRLCMGVSDKQLTAGGVNYEFVDEQMKELSSLESGLSEPNLAICCGPTASTLGFLPWHLRLTEILCIPSHHKVEYVDFLSVLHRYARTEQRFGV